MASSSKQVDAGCLSPFLEQPVRPHAPCREFEIVKRRLFVLLLAMLLTPAWASADGVRYYVENGVTYAETTRTVRRPVCETRYEERERTVYRRQTRTEL